MYTTANDEVQNRIKRLIRELQNTVRTSDECTELVKGKARMSKSLKDTLAELKEVLLGAESRFDEIIAPVSNKMIASSGGTIAEENERVTVTIKDEEDD
jgi:histone H3/H4